MNHEENLLKKPFHQCLTCGKVMEIERRSERNDLLTQLISEVEKRKNERNDDPWAHGFNMDMTAGSVEDLNYVLSLLKSKLPK